LGIAGITGITGITAVALLGLGSVTVPATAAASRTYSPPYSAGPQGGDSNNFISNDPTTGRITVARAYPSPGAFNCAGKGGFAYDRIRPKVTGKVTAVTVDVSDVVVDPYTWIKLSVRDYTGRWIGSKTVRGPLTGGAQLSTPVQWRTAMVGHPMTIDVGLEVASACPNVDGGTARFADIVVAGSGAAWPAGSGGGGGTGLGSVPSVWPPSSAMTTVNFEFMPGDDDPPADVKAPLNVARGTALAYVNADTTAPHTVTSVGRDAAGRPLFDSGEPLGAGSGTLVAGVERLAVGSYPFYCKVHTSMRGVLNVVGS